MEEPAEILDRKEKVLRNRVIPYVKVLWRSHSVEEATWESEESMKSSYPWLFLTSGILISGTKFSKWGRVVTPQTS